MFTNLILIIGRCHQHPHFMDEDTQAQTDEVTHAQRHLASGRVRIQIQSVPPFHLYVLCTCDVLPSILHVSPSLKAQQ